MYARAIVGAFGVCATLAGTRTACASDRDRDEPGVLSVGTGVGVRAARDDIIVPLASTGPTLRLFGDYAGIHRGVVVETGVYLAMGALFDRNAHPAATIAHGLRLAALPVVARPDRARAGDGWSLAVGPALAWTTDVLWLAKWDDAHAYWMGRRWLGVGARGWRRVASSEWRLDVSGELAVVGFESRPPGYRANKEDALTHVSYYVADVNRSPELGWLGQWQAMRVAVELRRPRAPGRTADAWSGLGLGLEARFDHTERPAAAYLFETTLLVSHVWGRP